MSEDYGARSGLRLFLRGLFSKVTPRANLNTLVTIQAAEDATSLPSAAAVPEDRLGADSAAQGI